MHTGKDFPPLDLLPHSPEPRDAAISICVHMHTMAHTAMHGGTLDHEEFEVLGRMYAGIIDDMPPDEVADLASLYMSRPWRALQLAYMSGLQEISNAAALDVDGSLEVVERFLRLAELYRE